MRPTDHQPKAGATTREVGLATIKRDWEAAYCSCGAVKYHKRAKVLEDWMEKHITKKHQGRGIWI